MNSNPYIPLLLLIHPLIIDYSVNATSFIVFLLASTCPSTPRRLDLPSSNKIEPRRDQPHPHLCQIYLSTLQRRLPLPLHTRPKNILGIHDGGYESLSRQSPSDLCVFSIFFVPLYIRFHLSTTIYPHIKFFMRIQRTMARLASSRSSRALASGSCSGKSISKKIRSTRSVSHLYLLLKFQRICRDCHLTSLSLRGRAYERRAIFRPWREVLLIPAIWLQFEGSWNRCIISSHSAIASASSIID